MNANCHELIEQLRTNVPLELRNLGQWVVWRMEERNGKPTKVPHDPKTGNRGNSTNSATWSSFHQACQTYCTGAYAGLGFVFSQHDPYVGVDFDDCVRNGKVDPERLGILQELDSYTEFSQSEYGIHVIVRGALPEHGRKSTAHKIEMYDQGRFFVMTGQHLPEAPSTINNRADAVACLHRELFGQPTLSANEVSNSATHSLTLDDRELLDRMFDSKCGDQIRLLWNGDISGHNNDHSAADLALCNHLAFWTTGDVKRIDSLFRQSGLMREKWDRRARTGETYGRGTIARALAGTSERYSPPLSLALPSDRNGAGGGGNGSNDHQNGADGDNGYPLIVTNNRQLPEITQDVLKAIQRTNEQTFTTPVVYIRAGLLTRIVEDENGEHVTQPLHEAAARGIFARCAQWGRAHTDRMGIQQIKPVFPPATVVRDVLALGNWPQLPTLTGIVQCPTFSAEGKLHTSYGYDTATQLFNASRLRLGDIQPITNNIRRAKRLIFNELLVDFPFDSQASRAHALALLLLPFVRPMIDGPTPLHAIDAPTPGTGKGLLANICSFPARGRDLASTPAAQDDSEWRKRLTASILRSDSHVLIDNVNQPLDSASFALALTQSVWADRLLGQTCTVTLPITQVWAATGNNLVVSDEIARRAIRIRLDANVERPDQRLAFKHDNLMQWVRTNRSLLVSAALTLINAWVQEGMPLYKTKRKGSYEAWTEAMGGILNTVNVAGFLENEHEMYEAASTETARLVEFIEAWHERYGEEEVRPKELFQLASKPDGPVPLGEIGQWQGLLDDTLGAGNERSRRTKFGLLLEGNRDKVICGYKLVKNFSDKKRPRFSLHKVLHGN